MGADWVSQANRSHVAAQRQLAQSLPSYNVPIADSRATMPGYIKLGEYIYCYPDVAYPWDPAVIRAVREFEPTAVPFTYRTIWREMDYGNPTPADRPLILVRHGMARAARDLRIPGHDFRCEMPVHPTPALRSNAHVLSPIRPNWLEVFWHDREDRPYGRDITGAYIACDWEFHHCLRRDYLDQRRGSDISNELLGNRKARLDAIEQHRADDDAYIARDLDPKKWDEVSDREWKEAHLAGSEPDLPPATVNVPDAYDVPAPPPIAPEIPAESSVA